VVVEAHDGVEALDYLCGTGAHAGRDVRDQPQLVLLDLELPRIDGLEVLAPRASRSRTRLQPVVILTSSNEQKDPRGWLRPRANSYIRKPVDFAEFSEAVRQLGLYWLLVNSRHPRLKEHHEQDDSLPVG